jgi:hypothetical protein
MKWTGCLAVVVAGVLWAMSGCNQPVGRVEVPRPDDASAYRPQPVPRPLPGYTTGGAAGVGGGEATGGGGGLTISPNPSIRNEDQFVAAYAKRNPRIMVMVNRNLPGDSLSVDDYSMIEASIVQYFDNSGKVQVKDSEAMRSKLSREQILRVENGDSDTNRLLATELQADLLIRVSARPTSQAAVGPAIRMIAKAVTTTDARNMGTATVDMPMPMTKPMINYYTRFLSEELMGQMALKWAQPAEYDPIEVRIYKAATIDDSMKIASWIKPAPGVKSVDIRAATASSTTSYAVLAVAFDGAPWMLYQELKDGIGQSQGLKAVDLSNNTISLEITGPMTLTTTTKRVETTTTTETKTTEVQRIEQVNPATPR